MKNNENTTLAFSPPSLLSPTPPLVLLLLLLLLSGPRGCPCPALALDCHADISVTGVDTVANITPKQEEEADRKLITLFVDPDPGFRGVSLVAEVADSDGGEGGVAGELVVAWFSLSDTCFRQHADWWQLEAEAWRLQHADGTREQLGFRVEVGHCSSVCQRGRFRFLESLQVWAYGASRWKFTTPDNGCGTTINVSNSPAQAPTSCSDPPAPPHKPLSTTPPARPTTLAAFTIPAAETDTATPTLPTHAVVGVVAAVLAVVSGTVVVVVVVVRRRRRRMTTTEDAEADTVQRRRRRRSPAPSRVREEVVNSLYEPFESLAPSCVREEVVNSLYEPFESLAPSCVKEEVVNNLYEPFESLHQPPPADAATTELQKRW